MYVITPATGMRDRRAAVIRPMAAILWLGVLAAGCASPQPVAGVMSGRIDATAFRSLPEGAPIAVSPPDDTPRSIRLTRLLAGALAARGIPAENDAALVLTYEATTTTATATARAGFPDIGLAGVIGSSGTRDVGLTIGLPIFGFGRRSADRYEYVVEMAVAERDGSRLWQARAVGLAGTGDIVEIARTVFPVLIGQIGRTARGIGIPNGQHP